MSGVVDGGNPTGARPTPWALPPDGFHFEAVVDEGWIVPPIGAGRCRWGASPGMSACGAPAVATLMRPVYAHAGRRNQAWDYCAEHLYGRWIEDGKVMGWRLVEDA